ncbi:uncharacterized protein LOC131143804 [Malania oleifera]|uniref:uncharacterized protein LOC131143804 n=1 Tax=Malania oleifera TaxID=397392 RepID=UPI0025AEBC1E|nr:uncharacterized protein LOC131143804 [Malania oleifera]
MAGLLAWAADVVGGGGQGGEEDDNDRIPVVFTPEQEKYARELVNKAASLSRSIQDLRMRLPPPDISQRLPHLHAHSLASNAALALQLNSHSATKEQAQLREVTLQEENAEYEKAISNCENRIQEKLQEADLLQRKLEEVDMTEKNLRAELESAQAARDTKRLGASSDLMAESETSAELHTDTEPLELDILEILASKKKELASMEAMVQDLEEKWAQVQDNALKQPSPAQRERILDKQLHSLIEQLAAKQTQAEALVSEVHAEEKELERLNGLWRRFETRNMEASAARNRFGRNGSMKGSASSDYIVDPHQKPSYYHAGRTENQKKLMLLRSTFVLYILALHILVFIKILF